MFIVFQNDLKPIKMRWAITQSYASLTAAMKGIQLKLTGHAS